MKYKFPILIAAGLFLATVSKAQYGGGYGDNRVIIQGQIHIPGPAYVGYGYNNQARFEDRRYADNGRFDDRRYDDHDRYYERRDWRADEYERYCRDHREYRGDRRAYYRDHCDYRPAPFCPAPRVFVHY